MQMNSDPFDPSLKNVNLASEHLGEIFRQMQRVPIDAPPAWFRARGYGFELLIRAALDREGLKPRAPYKTSGEQIDGSFLLDGRTYLLEAKWTKDPLPASAVYAFKGKVAGKLVGTVGFIISMAGFGDDTVDAVTLGKSLDVLLMDMADVGNSLASTGNLKEVLRSKIRSAAEDGIVYLPSRIEEQNLGIPSGQSSTSAITEVNWSTDLVDSAEKTVVLVLESSKDLPLVQRFIEIIGRSSRSTGKIRYMTAGGAFAALRLVPALRRSAAGERIVLILDSNLDLEELDSSNPAAISREDILQQETVLKWARRVVGFQQQDLLSQFLTRLELSDPEFARFSANFRTISDDSH